MPLSQEKPSTKYGAAFHILALLFLLVFIGSFVLSIYIPTYADEFFWKIQISRFFFDEGKLLGLSPMCEQSFLIDTPLSWYPMVWLNSLLYIGVHSLSQLKLVGLFGSVTLFALWVWMTRLSLGLRWIQAFIFVAGFLSVGVLPFLLTFNRPEQSLLFFISLGLWIPLILPHIQLSQTRPKLRHLLLFLSYCLLCALLCATHPKSLFLLPILLIAYWGCNVSRTKLLLLSAFMLWCAVQTTTIWSAKSFCPESPFLMQVMKDISLSIGLIKTAPLAFIFMGKDNLLLFSKYISGIYFQNLFQSSWLPAISTTQGLTAWIEIANLLCWVPLLFTLGFVVRAILTKPLKANIKQLGLIFFFLMALMALAFQQTTKNFYEAGLVFPLLLLLCIATFTPHNGNLKKQVVTWVIPLCLITGIYSGILRADIFITQWSHLFSSGPILNSSPLTNASNQPSLLKNFAREQCGIDDNAKTLILDQTSYPVFYQQAFPIFENYLFGYFATGSDYRQVIQAHDVGGLITNCAVIPPDLLSKAVREGNMCCLSKSNLLSSP